MRKNKGRLSQAITTIDVAAEAKHGEKSFTWEDDELREEKEKKIV